MIHSIEADIGVYRRLGEQSAGIFARDFESQAWEISKNPKPFRFSYRFLREGDQTKLVHESDLLLGKDIMEGVNPNLRGGLEALQIGLAREELIAGEINTSVVFISPKKADETDVNYPMTQINLAQKLSEKEAVVRQFQFNLDLRGSARFLNTLAGMEVVNEQPSLAELMRAVIYFSGHISDDEILLIARKVYGENFEDEIGFQQTLGMPVEEAGIKYLAFIKQGLAAEELKQKRSQILFQTLDYSTFKQYYPEGEPIETSCGRIDFEGGSSGVVPSWCEYNTITGEFKCKLCQKYFSRVGINLHRCVC